MELRQLRQFVAVVEAGSFTAAAAQLHLAQPSLSVAVARLEAEFGVSLLTRTARGVEPTAAGRFLLSSGARLVAEADDVTAALRRFGAGMSGAITLAAAPVLMWHRVPGLLRAFAADAPDVEVRLVDPPPWEAIEMLRHRAADVAAVMVADPRRFAARYRDELDIVDWGDVPLVAALPPGRDAAVDPLPLTSFEGADVVLPRRSAAVPSLPEAVDDAFRRHGVTPRSVREVATIQTSVPLIEAGVAVSILPDPDRASLERFRLVTRDLDPAPRPLRAFLLTRAGASVEAAIGRLLRVAGGMTPLDDRPPDA
jgi:LysR family transcriptional regulator, benzoate and cis,cis-muconate-responsive activator of ben and cat genes